MNTLPLLGLVLLTGTALAQPQPPACRDDPHYRALDFWVGEWRVATAEGEVQGHNRIERVLDGCAVMEHWSDVAGGSGKSLFYVIGGQWRQVWVTPYARVPGGVKEKHEVARFDDGGIRFRGTITRPDGSTYLDRTTLRPLNDGRVHQLIEVSDDDGANWQPSFDAFYERVDR